MDVGEKLRNYRRARGRSIREIASKTGVSSSLISKIEHGRATPSLSTLKKVAEELGIPMFYLFIEDEPGGLIVRKEKRVELKVAGGIRQYLASPDLRQKIEVVWTYAEPGASTGATPMEHKSEECTLVIQGVIRFYVGAEVYTLSEGDSIYLRQKMPHRWENAGPGPLTVVSAYSLD